MIGPVFRNHVVICGWNHRGVEIVKSVREMYDFPVVIINRTIDEIVEKVGVLPNVFIIPGDCAAESVLKSADVGFARSVVVLSDLSLGETTDARSVEIALAVEKIQVSVHTVVELKSVLNKPHFSWTKADELIADEEVSVKLVAQGIRHALSQHRFEAHEQHAQEKVLLGAYRGLVSPSESAAQISRIDLPWERAKALTFGGLLEKSLLRRIVPLAFVGYQRHVIEPRPGQDAWVSWKSDLLANPNPSAQASSLWPDWPHGNFPLGILLLTPGLGAADDLLTSL
jgi:hypothetical protein